MEKIVVLSDTQPPQVGWSVEGVRAVVANGLVIGDAQLLAHAMNARCVRGDQLLKEGVASAESGRVRGIITQKRKLTVYHTPPFWADTHTSCRLATGSDTAFFVAYILALVFDVRRIEYWRDPSRIAPIRGSVPLWRELEAKNISLKLRQN